MPRKVFESAAHGRSLDVASTSSSCKASGACRGSGGSALEIRDRHHGVIESALAIEPQNALNLLLVDSLYGLLKSVVRDVRADRLAELGRSLCLQDRQERALPFVFCLREVPYDGDHLAPYGEGEGLVHEIAQVHAQP